MDNRIRREIIPGVFLTYIPSGRFKTCYMSISLLRPLEKDAAARNNLLPRVLDRGTAQLPDMERIAARLDDLYGARLVPVVRKKGEVQCVGFASTFIDDRFVDDKELLEKVTELIGQMLLAPATVGGRFINEYVESEREKLIEDIRSVVNDKRRFCLNELVKAMCINEKFSISNMGTEPYAKLITGSRLFRHYAEIIGSSTIEIFYCGSAEIERVTDAIEQALAPLPQGEKTPVHTINRGAPAKPKFLSSETDGKQSNLAIGLRNPVSIADVRYPAAALMNSVFGGSATSKLFMNVREKLSLCYYASASYFKHKGLIIVSSGIEKDNYDKALDEILAQLKAMQNGEIEDWELESARQGMIGSLRATMDSPGMMEDFYLSRAIEGLDYDPDYLIRRLENVTKDEVIEMAQYTALDTVYFLKGMD